MEKVYGSCHVICPSPTTADAFRKKSKRNDIEVITISKYLSDQLGNLKVKRKVELQLHLSFVWKKYFSETKFEAFLQAFNLLTELRSFTLDFGQILELLEDRDEDIANAVKVFWYDLLENEILDEHQAIEYIKENLTQSIKTEQSFILWGFNHLSAGQIDFLKELSQHCDVYIPIPKLVLRNSRNTDWPFWLSTDLVFDEKEDNPSQINLLRFSKNRLNEKLKSLFNENQSKNIKVFLGTKNPGIKEINEVPLSNASFRSKVDLFNSVLTEEMNSIEKQNFSTGPDLLEYLEMECQNCIETFDISKSRRIRVLQLLVEHIKKWMELTEDDQFSYFDLRVMRNSIGLSLPRNYHMPLYSELNHQISGLESLFDFDDNSLKIICASSAYEKIKPGVTGYDPQMVSVLASLGPLKNPDFEFQMTRFFIMEILKGENSYLILENELEENDLGWEEILKSIKPVDHKGLKRSAKNMKYTENPLSEVPPRWVFSATKLQNYMDCPRQYYFKYHVQMPSAPSSKNLLMPYELGNLEHLVLKNYYEKTNKDLDSLVKETIQSYLETNYKKLSSFLIKKYFIEVRDQSTKLIKEIDKLLTNPDVKLKFEHPVKDKLEDDEFGGSIDLVVETPLGVGILDIKRSSSSIPSQTAIKNLDKIQVNYYAAHFPKEIIFMGYLNGSEPEKSIIFTGVEEVHEYLNNHQFFKSSLRGLDLEENLERYKVFEKELICSLKNERDFHARPLHLDVCKYCTIKNICPKGVGHGPA